MRLAARDVRRPKSIATAGKPFAMLSHARACGRVAAENLEDADALGSRFVGRHCAVGSDRAWLRDRRQAPRQASTHRLGRRASMVASRRLVFTRSPGLVGINDGAT